MRFVPTSSALRRKGVVAGVSVLALVLSACGSSSSSNGSSTSSSSSSTSSSSDTSSSSSSAMSSSTDTSASSAMTSSGSSAMTSTSGSSGGTGSAATATSAADLGGMDGLVAAANKEGALNVVALPPDWADYADIIAGFQKKYPNIKLTSLLPDASSAQEISAAQTAKGTDQAPDVFDLGSAVTLASTAYFAPYKVAAWSDIPDANKEATGLWYNDYTGVMSVGYNADLTGDLSSLADLTNPKLKGLVALNGDPTQANSPLQAVMMASLANGGSADDISKGVDYFKSLKAAGTLSSTKASSQAVAAGTIGVVFDWSYNQLAVQAAGAKAGLTWKTFTPKGVTLTAYYNQAINKDAPHPAAARLWEEYLYTAEAQNFWIKGGALPILYPAMQKAGTVDATAAKNLPAITGDSVQLTADQNTAANKYLAANWAKAVG